MDIHGSVRQDLYAATAFGNSAANAECPEVGQKPSIPPYAVVFPEADPRREIGVESEHNKVEEQFSYDRPY